MDKEQYSPIERKTVDSSQPESNLELSVKTNDTVFRGAKCRFCRDGSSTGNYLTLMPVKDQILGDIEAPYHHNCYVEEHSPKPETEEEKIARLQKEKEDKLARLKQAESLVYRITPKNDASLSGVAKLLASSVIPYLHLVQTIENTYDFNRAEKTLAKNYYSYKSDDELITVGNLLIDAVIIATGISGVMTNELDLLPICLFTFTPLKSCFIYFSDYLKRKTITRDYKAFKREVEE